MDKKKKLEELKKRLESILTKISESFAKYLETLNEDDRKKYEDLSKVRDTLEEEVSDLEGKIALEEADRNPPPTTVTEEAGRPGQLSEEVNNFITRIRETVTVGGRFTGTLPLDVTNMIQKKKEEIATLRNLCTVHRVSGEYLVYVEGNELSIDYVDQKAKIGETEATLEGIKLSALKLAGIAKISNEMIKDVNVDLVNYIVEKFAKALAKKEDAEILLGAGTSSNTTKIRGIITGAKAENTVTAASNTVITWEEVKKTLSKVSAYRAGATIVCSAEVADMIQEFKDGSEYIFDQGSELKAIKGIKVVISSAMPAVAATNAVLVVGDFSYYHIAERNTMDVSILDQTYAATDQTGVRVTERIDGDFVPEAFAVLKMKAGG